MSLYNKVNLMVTELTTHPTNDQAWMGLLDCKTTKLVNKMVAADPINSEEDAEELIIDYLTHAIHAKLGHIHPDSNAPYEMPGGLDYPEFAYEEFAIMDEFVEWVAA